MATATLERRATLKDLEALPDPGGYELVGGELVERNTSIDSTETSFNVGGVLWAYVRANRLGRCFSSELGIQLHPNDPTHTRRADVSFVARARAPRVEAGYLRIPPDLVVESVSPNDTAEDVLAKAREWLAHGVRMVWMIYPGAGQVQIYRPGERPRLLSGDDEITGEDVVPGFCTSIANFMPDHFEDDIAPEA